MELSILRDLLDMCGDEVGGGMHAQLMYENDQDWDGKDDGSTLHPATTALKQTYMELSGYVEEGTTPEDEDLYDSESDSDGSREESEESDESGSKEESEGMDEENKDPVIDDA